MEGVKRTALHEEHLAAGAKMVPFAGYEMPIEYQGIVAEHRAVRSSMGMFDLSHMGEIVLEGEDVLDATDRLMTNEVRNLAVGQARYSPMCRESGGIIDDLLIYRFPTQVMLVVNASNRAKDYDWIVAQLPQSVTARDVSDDVALIAIQGPDAVAFVQSLASVDVEDLASYHFLEGSVLGIPCTVSRTGYTGEDGVEIYVASERAAELWRGLRAASNTLALVGLGARDTLRLEAGLALYGNDITEETTPLEAGLGWTVKLSDRQFIGSDALQRQKDDGVSRRLMAFEMADRAIARPHAAMLSGDLTIGEVASGTFSPTFSKGIGMAYIEREHATVGREVEVDIRGQRHPARIVKKPLYRRPQA